MTTMGMAPISLGLLAVTAGHRIGNIWVLPPAAILLF